MLVGSFSGVSEGTDDVCIAATTVDRRMQYCKDRSP